MTCPLCNKENINFLRLDGNENATLIANRFPGNNFHLLVIPNEHHATADDMPLEVWLDLCLLIRKTIHRICDFVKYQEILIFSNEGEIAGQRLEHFHWHIVVKTDERDSFSSVRPKKNIETFFNNQWESGEFFIRSTFAGINFINQIVVRNEKVRKLDHFSEESWIRIMKKLRELIISYKKNHKDGWPEYFLLSKEIFGNPLHHLICRPVSR